MKQKGQVRLKKRGQDPGRRDEETQATCEYPPPETNSIQLISGLEKVKIGFHTLRWSTAAFGQ